MLDPGLSFGTGEHFTTRFCLEMLDQLCQKTPPASCFDAGTGSGVLAIAAALLGCPRVVGVDYDPLALEQAAENAGRNRVKRRVRWRQMDLSQETPAGTFEVVCANLYGSLLLATAPAWTGLGPRAIVVSGLLEAEADGAAETFRQLGYDETVRDGDGEWAGLLLERKQ